MKILLITSRNVYGTSGELRLIKNRTETLLHKYSVETDIVLYKREKVLKKPQERFDYNSFEGVYYNWHNHPFKIRHFLRLVKKKTTDGQYDAVIVSGSFLLYNMVKYVKSISPNTKVIVDIHGTIEELKEFPGKSFMQKIVRKAFYFVSKGSQKKAFSVADGFLVVSKALKKHIQSLVSNVEDKPFFIIPCGLKETEIDYDDAQKNRALYRAKYNIKDDELLFIYSGGVSPWQCIEESVSLFKHYHDETNRKCKMLILSSNVTYISKFKNDSIIVDSYSGDEVRRVLNAGDYAFLLRGDYMTNHVAYPNKFLEYVSSGMRIIATENVDDVAMQVRNYTVGVIVNLDDFLSVNLSNDTFEYLSDIKRRNALLLDTSFETTLKPFVKYLEA